MWRYTGIDVAIHKKVVVMRTKSRPCKRVGVADRCVENLEANDCVSRLDDNVLELLGFGGNEQGVQEGDPIGDSCFHGSISNDGCSLLSTSESLHGLGHLERGVTDASTSTDVVSATAGQFQGRSALKRILDKSYQVKLEHAWVSKYKMCSSTSDTSLLKDVVSDVAEGACDPKTSQQRLPFLSSCSGSLFQEMSEPRQVMHTQERPRGVNRFPMNLDFESGIASYARPRDVACSEYYAGGLPIAERCEGGVVLDNLDSHTYSSVIDVESCGRGRGRGRAVGKRYEHMLQPLTETFKRRRLSTEATGTSLNTDSYVASVGRSAVASTSDTSLLKDVVSNVVGGACDPKVSQEIVAFSSSCSGSLFEEMSPIAGQVN